MACTGESVCAAVDNAGQEVTFDPSSPTEPTAPTRTEIDYRNGVNIELTGVACATPSLCAATDADGDLLTFAPAAASSAVNHVDRSRLRARGRRLPLGRAVHGRR